MLVTPIFSACYIGALEPVPPKPPAGLCPLCMQSKEIVNDRGSVFLQCQLAFSDARFPKYPRLPVLECDGFVPRRHG
jgi:hypothetical protein